MESEYDRRELTADEDKRIVDLNGMLFDEREIERAGLVAERSRGIQQGILVKVMADHMAGKTLRDCVSMLVRGEWISKKPTLLLGMRLLWKTSWSKHLQATWGRCTSLDLAIGLSNVFKSWCRAERFDR